MFQEMLGGFQSAGTFLQQSPPNIFVKSQLARRLDGSCFKIGNFRHFPIPRFRYKTSELSAVFSTMMDF